MSNRDMLRLIKELQSEGWVYLGQNRHTKMKAPNGAIIILSSSPSCVHAAKNARKMADKLYSKDLKENPNNN